ncbi:GUN4 domain-containing protein [Nostoc sp. FACHB-892]|nr:GUN4 domain-containing protein [Nostoc sp. FACHB-892]
MLKHLQEQLGLTDEEARTVLDKVLEPYGKYRENLDQYKQIFTELVDEQGYPLGEKAKADLKKLQQYLKLKDEDVALIDKEAEDQKQNQEKGRQIAKSILEEEAKRLQKKQQPTQTTTAKPIQETDNLPSEKSIDYTWLRDLLKARQWKEADEETLAVMLKATGRSKEGWLDSESINNFPCADLRTIDQLWVKYSNGHFGFSVQKQIWESVGKDYDKFGDRVGWRKGEWLSYSDLTFRPEVTPQGHLPGITPVVALTGSAPTGWGWWGYKLHLGVYVVGVLFSRVETCKL